MENGFYFKFQDERKTERIKQNESSHRTQFVNKKDEIVVKTIIVDTAIKRWEVFCLLLFI